MSSANLFAFLIVGAIVGWLAGIFTQNTDSSAAGNMMIGIAGAFIGGVLLSLIGSFEMIGAIISAIIGAALLLLIIRFFKKSSS